MMDRVVGLTSSSGCGRGNDVVSIALSNAVCPPQSPCMILQQRCRVNGWNAEIMATTDRIMNARSLLGSVGANRRWSNKEGASAAWKHLKEAGAKCSKRDRAGWSYASRNWFRGLQSETIHPSFGRKNNVVEGVHPSNDRLGRCALPRQTAAEGATAGRDGQGQIGDERMLPQNSFASHILSFALVISLYLGNPWCSQDPAMARAATLDEYGESFNVEKEMSIKSNLPFDPRESNLGMESTPARDSLSLKQPGYSPSTMSSLVYPFQSHPPGFMFSLAETKGACTESYGFLPCSNSLGGNLSLMVAYGYFLLLAAQLISNGSELLLEVMNPGLIGGLLLPVLGALPDALLIFVSGVGGTVQEAQQQVMVGIGVLAGSIVMLLTLGWAGSLYAGRCDLSGPGGTAKDRTLTRSLDWTGTGVTTDEQTREGAWVMVLSVLPFILVQIPLLDGHPSEGPEAAIIGAVVAAIGLVGYSFYQVAYPWLQQKRIEEARLLFMRSRAVQNVALFSGTLGGGSSKQESMFPSVGHLKEIFTSFDLNKDGKIQKEELTGLLIGLGLEEEGSIPERTQLELWLQEFDVDFDGTLTEHEFLTGIKKWAQRISKEKKSKKFQRLESSLAANDDSGFWAAQSSEAKKVLDLLESEAGGDEDDEEEKDESAAPGTVKRNAALYLAGGAALAAIFADPLVDSIGGFSAASGIPPFFVAFVVTPFASNASELLSSIIFAKGRRKKNISLTFSQLYGGVTMNNTLCLGIFLAVVYVRGLTWDFSSEVTVILASVITMGLLGSSRTTFPLWFAGPVLAIYPLCISLVALLDNVLGWQ